MCDVLHVVYQKDRMIRVGDETIYPVDLEMAIHDKIREWPRKNHRRQGVVKVDTEPAGSLTWTQGRPALVACTILGVAHIEMGRSVGYRLPPKPHRVPTPEWRMDWARQHLATVREPADLAGLDRLMTGVDWRADGADPPLPVLVYATGRTPTRRIGSVLRVLWRHRVQVYSAGEARPGPPRVDVWIDSTEHPSPDRIVHDGVIRIYFGGIRRATQLPPEERWERLPRLFRGERLERARAAGDCVRPQY